MNALIETGTANTPIIRGKQIGKCRVEAAYNYATEQVILTAYSLVDSRVTAMKKARQNNIDRIKDRLKLNMKATGLDSVSCSLFKVSYRETKDNAVELDEALFFANNLNEDFVSVKVSPNKTAIKNALKNGESVIGAKLVNSQTLTIR